MMLSVYWVVTSLIASVSCEIDTTSGLTVDLDYAVYQGYYNDTFDLNIWKR